MVEGSSKQMDQMSAFQVVGQLSTHDCSALLRHTGTRKWKDVESVMYTDRLGKGY